MNDATKLRIRRELAERMGWQYRPECCLMNSGKRDCWMDDDGNCHSAPPDPYESAADKDALMEWLAADDARWAQFEAIIRPLFGESWRRLLSAPRDIITDAAWLAIQEQPK